MCTRRASALLTFSAAPRLFTQTAIFMLRSVTNCRLLRFVPCVSKYAVDGMRVRTQLVRKYFLVQIRDLYTEYEKGIAGVPKLTLTLSVPN
jgi:hypothetical protein